MQTIRTHITNRSIFLSLCFSSSLMGMGLTLPPGLAQVVSDGTVGTTVSGGPNFTITNGTQVGGNLFHSFSQFSVPTGGAAIFNNALTVQNIFSRVTGGSVSNIDGLIQANGTANVFLLNPAGIVFGPNARLQIGGSFLGSTASSIRFADGTEFSATNATGTPLLTINAPVGLNFGTNPGAIQVNTPAASNSQGLTIRPTQTIALIGGDLNFTGGRITANGGRIELGSVGANSQVTLNPNSQGWALDYTGVTGFQDIRLTQAARVSSNGTGGGNIQVQGRNITLLETSKIDSLTLGAANGGTLTVRATDTVEIESIPTDVGNQTRLLTSVAPGATGKGGDLIVEAGQRISVRKAGMIETLTFGQGNGGNIFLQAPEIEVRDFAQATFTTALVAAYSSPTATGNSGNLTINTRSFLVDASIVSTSTFGNGNAGNLSINAEQVKLLNGAQVQSFTTGGRGNASTIVIRASDSVEIIGVTPFVVQPNGFPALSVPGKPAFSSLLANTVTRASGNGGTILIETGQLRLAQGGALITNTTTSGQGGTIEIRATEVEVSDAVVDFSGAISGIASVSAGLNSGNGGSIRITADRLRVLNGGSISTDTSSKGKAGDITLQVNQIDLQGISQPFEDRSQLPSRVTAASTGTAAAGSVNLVSDRLSVQDGANITVSNTGGGDAGNLSVNANQIILKDGGSLRAEVAAGNQGNILLTARDYLLMRQQGLISTNATGTATGGNITINSPVIIGLENSDIVANAVEGAGGNIQITTQSLLGLQFRPFLTPENDITASSQFGLSGTVIISTPEVNPNADVVELPSTLVDPTQQVGQGCNTYKDSRFVATGRGGLPENPRQRLTGRSTWTDVREVSQTSNANESFSPQVIQPSVVEATGWRKIANGKVELFATGGSVTHIGAPSTCRTGDRPSR